MSKKLYIFALRFPLKVPFFQKVSFFGWCPLLWKSSAASNLTLSLIVTVTLFDNIFYIILLLEI